MTTSRITSCVRDGLAARPVAVEIELPDPAETRRAGETTR